MENGVVMHFVKKKKNFRQQVNHLIQNEKNTKMPTAVYIKMLKILMHNIYISIFTSDVTKF